MYLKHKHRVYNHDFESREEFLKEIDSKLEGLEDLRHDLKELYNHEFNCWEHNKAKTTFRDLIEEAISEISTTISEVQDLRGRIR